MTLSILDIIFLVIIIVLAIICAMKGFIKEVLGKGALVLGIWMAILFYRLPLRFVMQYIDIQLLAIAASFLIVFLVVYFVVMLVRQLLSAIFQHEIFRGLDMILGLVFGAIEGLGVTAIILIVLAAQHWVDVNNLLNSSIFYNFLEAFIATPVQSVAGIINPEVIIPLGNGA